MGQEGCQGLWDQPSVFCFRTGAVRMFGLCSGRPSSLFLCTWVMLSPALRVAGHRAAPAVLRRSRTLPADAGGQALPENLLSTFPTRC